MEASFETGTESSDSISLNAPLCHSMMLPDQGDSSSEDELSGKKSPPSLRLESALSTLDAHQHTLHSDDQSNPPESSLLQERPGNKAWDDFVRKGSRLKNFMEDALQLATCKDRVESCERPLIEEDIIQSPAKRARRVNLTVSSHAADLAREKTAECMILQQKLQEVEADAGAMRSANTSLRESASASTDRADRLTDALRIAGQNAANARCDADAAESYASSLAAQLESLRSVVDETKRVSETLYVEHELISQAARTIEAKLLQRETEFARAQKEQKQLLEEQGTLLRKIKTGKDDHKRLEVQLESSLEEMNHAKREVQERESVDKARKDRSAMVEKELREARAILADAASTAAETEATTSVLKDTIRGLQTENTALHERMCEIQDKTQKEQERLHDSLGKAEREAQSLRVNAAGHDEDMQRLRSDMNSCDKQTTQLKTRIANLERRLKEATSVMPLSSHDTPSSATKTPDNRKSFPIPPLTPARDMPVTSNSPKSSMCSICSKLASGMMKSCQCGQRGCDKRAHSACVARTYSPSLSSLSHLGSPAPSALLLCAHTSM